LFKVTDSPDGGKRRGREGTFHPMVKEVYANKRGFTHLPTFLPNYHKQTIFQRWRGTSNVVERRDSVLE
jgi:hypothetical protein